ncbi:MAG: hypothetical protein JNM66_20710 [Bryobacterales bacterium]|nr:hypothetical protein [Bryobacterales bacterium]
MHAAKSWIKALAPLVVFAAGLNAADFTFYTTMQAGFPGALSWELGAGSSSATTQSQVNYGYDPAATAPSWRAAGAPQSFEIGYRQSTNRGFVTVYNNAGAPVTASFVNTGPALGPNTTWTIPTASFFTTASALFLPASISVENLTLSSGVQILSGSLPNSIGSSFSGSGPAVSSSLGAPIVINPSSNGGDWTISGTIRFTGVIGGGGLAFGDQLRFGFGASGADTATPETSSALLIGAGLIALGCLRNRRKPTAAV